jgi:hypothetical protein
MPARAAQETDDSQELFTSHNTRSSNLWPHLSLGLTLRVTLLRRDIFTLRRQGENFFEPVLIAHRFSASCGVHGA